MLNLSDVSVVPLDKSIVLNRFTCGKPVLDRFLKNKALKAERRLEMRVFVALVGESKNCWGYYALQVGSDQVPDTPREKSTYLKAGYVAFPAVNLSYLAVHSDLQGEGLGRYLLMDAFEKVAEISDRAGLYALTLQSLDDTSTAFYSSLGFEVYAEGANPKMLYPIRNIVALVR